MEWLGIILGACVFLAGVVALFVVERYTVKEARKRAQVDAETIKLLQDMSRRRHRAAEEESKA